MAYKMKGFSGFGNSPIKQTDSTKTYPKSYTKKDIEFLKEQKEDVVRYEDLDEEGKKIWDKLRKGTPKTSDKFKKGVKKQTKKIVDTVKSGPSKTKSPAKVSDSDVVAAQKELNKVELDFREPGWTKAARGTLEGVKKVLGSLGKGAE